MVGDQVVITRYELEEVGMPGDRTEVEVGHSWTGSVISISPEHGMVEVGSPDGAVEKLAIEALGRPASVPDAEGHWQYEIRR